MSKKLIKRKIAEGDLQEVIDQLIDLSEVYQLSLKVENELYNLSGQLHDCTKARRSGNLSSSEFNTNISNLRTSLLRLLDNHFDEIDKTYTSGRLKELDSRDVIKGQELKRMGGQESYRLSNTQRHRRPKYNKESGIIKEVFVIHEGLSETIYYRLEDDKFDVIQGREIPDAIRDLHLRGRIDSKNKNFDSKDSNVVLFLSANPSKTALLKLKDEHSNIATELQDSNTLKAKSEEAFSFSEFSKAIYSHEPKIVHFSGHGDLEAPEVQEAYRVRGIGKPKGQEESKEDQEEPGIILFDESKRNSHFVKASVLKELFSTAKMDMEIPLQAVIFNACHSEGQAKAVSEAGISVIGTSHSVEDLAAIAFSKGFYFGMAEGKGIEKSFKLARVQAMAYGEPKDRFTLYVNGEKQQI